MLDLYVSWEEYHQNIETLAVKIYQSGWDFNQIVCLAKEECASEIFSVDCTNDHSLSSQQLLMEERKIAFEGKLLFPNTCQ